MAKVSSYVWLMAMLVLVSLLPQALPATPAGQTKSFILAEGGKTDYQIVISAEASEVDQFAAHELQRYLGRMTGATFPVLKGGASGNVIRIGSEMLPSGFIANHQLGFDGYVEQAKPGKILLAGVNG